MPRPTLLYHLYRGATAGLAPFALRKVTAKLRAAGVDETRLAERRGQATLPRPAGPLIWFHGASVGETLSVLTLIRHLGERLPKAEFLITSGTATSAELVAKRMPPRTRHQFAPVDAPGAVARFLDHWRPDAGIFVESELWPNVLVAARARGVRLALINARLSEKSARDWRKFPDTARFVLDQFSAYVAQNQTSADLLRSMGADPDRLSVGVNLKLTSDPLPVDQTLLEQTRAALAGRPVWVASSTHPGEDELVIAAQQTLLRDRPDLCLLLAPRHPERGDAVAAMLRNAGLGTAQRSKGEALDGHQVYLADTLGEVGTWYALSRIVLMAGAFAPLGGHNPIEPAQAGAAVITGPEHFNFAETYGPLLKLGGAVEVRDATALAMAVTRWLDQPETLDSAARAAHDYVDRQRAALDRIMDTIIKALDLDD